MPQSSLPGEVTRLSTERLEEIHCWNKLCILEAFWACALPSDSRTKMNLPDASSRPRAVAVAAVADLAAMESKVV